MGGLSFTYVPERNKNPLYMKFLASAYRASEEEKFDILGFYRLVTDRNRTRGQYRTGDSRTRHRNTAYIHQKLSVSIPFITSSTKEALSLQNDATTNIKGTNHFLQWGLKFQREQFDDKINEWERLDSAGYFLALLRLQRSCSLKVLKSENNIRKQSIAGILSG
jgi:hypothetical protein